MKIGFGGLDASKGYCDFSLISKGNEFPHRKMNFIDNQLGVDELKRVLSLGLLSLDKIYLAIESTGGYENNWYNQLVSFDKRVIMFRINPLRTHHESKKNMHRNINDAISSEIIARHVSENYEELEKAKPRSLKFYTAKQMHKTIQGFIKQKTRNINQLEKVVYSCIPGLLTFSKNGMPKYMYKLLQKYPSKAKILNAKPASLAEIKGLTLEKAEAIQKAVSLDSGSGDTKLTELNIKSLAKNINSLAAQIKVLKSELAKHGANELADLLVTIPGCGIESAVSISIEIEDIKRFESASSLCCYFGVHPENHTSGDTSKKPKMSKKGSSSYRGTLYMVAKNVIMYDPYFKEIYQNQRAKGKTYDDALGVIMNKLTRIIFGMLTNEEAYNSSKPKAQRSKPVDVEKQIEKLEKEAAEYKTELEKMQNAPISQRTENKIKKAMEKSQNSIEELRTRSKPLPSANI
jgi:transposase